MSPINFTVFHHVICFMGSRLHVHPIVSVHPTLRSDLHSCAPPPNHVFHGSFFQLVSLYSCLRPHDFKYLFLFRAFSLSLFLLLTHVLSLRFYGVHSPLFISPAGRGVIRVGLSSSRSLQWRFAIVGSSNFDSRTHDIRALHP